MASTTIPQFLLPRGISQRTLRYLSRHSRHPKTLTSQPQQRRSASTTTSSSSNDDGKQRVLAQPDKFRPPSHPSRRVLPTRNGKVYAPPYNYPGPPLSAKEKEEMRTKRYPHMFPPEGTLMYKFLTSRWIHVWIALVEKKTPPSIYPKDGIFDLRRTSH